MRQSTRAIVRGTVVAALSIVGVMVLGAASVRAAEMPGNGLTVLHLRKNFYMIAGDGQNIGVQTGHDGVIVVNSGEADKTGALLAAIRKLSPLPIRFVIDTSAAAGAIGGNAALSAAGKSVFLPPKGPGASIMSYVGVLETVAAEPSYPHGGWPTDAYLTKSYSIYVNDEPVVLTHEAAASSDSDTFVLFRRSDVVMAGAVMDEDHFPVIDLAHGGSIQGEINALNHLLQIAIPPSPLIYEYNGTEVIPAHGRVCDQWEVVDYRDMIQIIRDTVANMMKHHMSLQQIEAAHPAKAYEPRYGATTGPWTTNMFIAAIYKSLRSSMKR